MSKRYINPTDKTKYMDFPDKFDTTFEEFKKQFQNNHVFRDLDPKKRSVELKKAFEIATKKAEK